MGVNREISELCAIRGFVFVAQRVCDRNVTLSFYARLHWGRSC